MSSTSVSASDDGMTASIGVAKTLVQPSIGTSNSVYDGGIQEVEGAMRYDHVLSSEDIALICRRAAAIGSTRGRPW